ncbi:MAG: PadR family transcriptional regulator [Bacteroidales bacterium]
MDLENTKAQMRKGILEYCILSVLSKNSCYASDIIKELKEARVIVVEGTLYPLLTRQKNGGLLSYRWEESPQGPPRKYYELTQEGRSYLAALDKSWNELVGSVNQIRNT